MAVGMMTGTCGRVGNMTDVMVESLIDALILGLGTSAEQGTARDIVSAATKIGIKTAGTEIVTGTGPEKGARAEMERGGGKGTRAKGEIETGKIRIGKETGSTGGTETTTATDKGDNGSCCGCKAFMPCDISADGSGEIFTHDREHRLEVMCNAVVAVHTCPCQWGVGTVVYPVYGHTFPYTCA